MNENSAADRARLRAAAEAGKRASAKLSPMEQDAKRGFGTLMIILAEVGLLAMAATRTGGWLSWALWALCALNALGAAFWGPGQRIKRRKMLLAREQVHQVRKLDADNPAGLGLGLLFDADPGLDHLSVEAGIRFALARVNAVIDEVDATTPDKVFGQPIDEFGKKGKR
jgi:hypothetical protein